MDESDTIGVLGKFRAVVHAAERRFLGFEEGFQVQIAVQSITNKYVDRLLLSFTNRGFDFLKVELLPKLWLVHNMNQLTMLVEHQDSPHRP